MAYPAMPKTHSGLFPAVSSEWAVASAGDVTSCSSLTAELRAVKTTSEPSPTGQLSEDDIVVKPAAPIHGPAGIFVVAPD